MVEHSAYFFDLGGTLIAIENDEIACSETGHVILLPGIREVLMNLHGKHVFVITNQAGVALGYLSETKAHHFIQQVNAEVGQVITDYRICMHHPQFGCSCRKPRPGMILDLAQAYELDLSRAVMIGDTANDKLCARSAGIGTFHWAQKFF